MYDLSNFTGEGVETIEAPAEVIWDLLADLSLTPQLNRETVETVWIPPSTRWEPGAMFRATNRVGTMEWTVECHVTVADRPTELGWTVLDPESPSSTWWYRLTPEPGGATRVRHGFQHGPSVSGVRMMIDREPHRAEEIVAGRIEMLTSNMRHTIEQVRALVG